jgi:hypothetical protein
VEHVPVERGLEHYESSWLGTETTRHLSSFSFLQLSDKLILLDYNIYLSDHKNRDALNFLAQIESGACAGGACNWKQQEYVGWVIR